MKFEYKQKREASSHSQRSVVMAPRGMVSTSHHLATLSGYRILSIGGNAVDAAVAMTSVLNVVEPHSAGLGGDAFALIYKAKEKKLYGMNASGRSPYAADISAIRNRGFDLMPERGPLSITVPGALHGWVDAVKKYGRLDISEVFKDAIFYAEHGFPVTEVIAGEWKNAAKILRSHPGGHAYLNNGNAPEPGDLFKNESLGHTYRRIIEDGPETFYGGALSQKIANFIQNHDGLLKEKDFQNHKTTWVEPICSDYRGYTIYELPPNGQGITALQMLNILEGYDLRAMKHNSAEYLHLLIEAKKIAFSDRDYYITDPSFEKVPVSELISKSYAAKCRKKIRYDKAMDIPLNLPFYTPSSETVYVTAVDEERNAVSLISSIYMHFGSGVVVDGTGIILQNRGYSFSLDPQKPNHLAPGKRPMHTIIPGMVFKDGDFIMSFGVMGGDMQPQGHTQFLVNVIDFGMNLQEAVDAPRIRHLKGSEVYLEDGITEKASSGLEAKGHKIIRGPQGINQVGGGQAIYLDRSQNILLGGSDRRKDGCAIGY